MFGKNNQGQSFGRQSIQLYTIAESFINQRNQSSLGQTQQLQKRMLQMTCTVSNKESQNILRRAFQQQYSRNKIRDFESSQKNVNEVVKSIILDRISSKQKQSDKRQETKQNGSNFKFYQNLDTNVEANLLQKVSRQLWQSVSTIKNIELQKRTDKFFKNNRLKEVRNKKIQAQLCILQELQDLQSLLKQKIIENLFSQCGQQ